jgi:hypothetical protein
MMITCRWGDRFRRALNSNIGSNSGSTGPIATRVMGQRPNMQRYYNNPRAAAAPLLDDMLAMQQTHKQELIVTGPREHMPM